MKFPSFTLTPLIICFVLGVLYYFQFRANSLFTNSQLLLLSLIGLAIAWRVKKRHSSFFLVALCIISFLVGINRGQQALQQNRDHYTFEYHKKEPNELLIEITDRLRPTATYHRYYGAVRALNNQKASGKLLVRIKKKDSLILELSSFIKTSNLLSPISASQNIGGFNYKDYLCNLRIFHQLEIDTLKVVENKKLGMRSWLRKLKQSQLNSIESSSFKTETKQLLMTLLLGERSELDRAWADRYAQAGIIHILAISGLHMGLLMILLGWLFKPLRYLPKGNYMHVIMVILCLWTYAFITGANPSVIRAATLFSLYSIGTYLKRKSSLVYS